MTLKIPIKHKSKGTHVMYIDEEDFDKIKDMVGDETKDHTIKITESTKNLFKRFLNKK